MSGVPAGFRRIPAAEDGDPEVPRFREVVGFGYDELVVGVVIEHRPGRTVTETDNVLMSTLTGNAAPIHLDAHYAAETRWGRPLVCSIVTLGIVAGMSVRSTSGLTVANLALTDMIFPRPVFVGDTLYAQTAILEKRRSRTQPESGIVTTRTDGHNQRGEQVISFVRRFMVPTNPDAVRDRTAY